MVGGHWHIFDYRSLLATMSRHALVSARDRCGALIGGGACGRCRRDASVGYGGVRAGRSARRLAAGAVSAAAVRWYAVALRPDASGAVNRRGSRHGARYQLLGASADCSTLLLSPRVVTSRGAGSSSLRSPRVGTTATAQCAAESSGTDRVGELPLGTQSGRHSLRAGKDRIRGYGAQSTR
ncbi:uncharacterized protein LOC118645161 [Monomorium pharaonis]|uniref:uncharacterized protein LOC118645161 n=1 Tax=Monomorium pharaonis TaxID=307658 RepID=UPI001746DFCE|nr:uncharacterized protein LOC118645161 [Monomorium pharaonis]